MVQNQVLFDRYIAVDWSASARPSPQRAKNSIWIAVLGPNGQPEIQNFRTRKEAIDYIAELLNKAKKPSRTLCGFDFPFGFPEGTAQMLTGRNNWASIWKLIADVIEDGPSNSNNRFQAAARLNGCFHCCEGPFWGRPPKTDIPALGTKMPHNRWGVNLPPYRRHVERVFPGQSVWQLYGQGAVGSQALTGIAALEKTLRPRDDVEIWPFETLGKGKCHVLAEIYPSLIEPVLGEGILDQKQVHAVAIRFRELDQAGRLAGRLLAPEGMLAAVRNEEGLFVDIT